MSESAEIMRPSRLSIRELPQGRTCGNSFRNRAPLIILARFCAPQASVPNNFAHEM